MRLSFPFFTRTNERTDARTQPGVIIDSNIQSSVRKMLACKEETPPHTIHYTHNTVYTQYTTHKCAHIQNACLQGKEPPTHNTLHTQYSIHTIQYTCAHIYNIIESSVSKMLPCQENRDPPPPHTHTTLHIHIMCTFSTTVICQEMLTCQENRDSPPHTHTTLHYTHTQCAYSTNGCLSGNASWVKIGSNLRE